MPVDRGPSGMRRGPLTIPLILLVMLLGACATRGSTDPVDPPDPPRTVSPGPVTVERGGGIAGVRDTVVVRPDGTWRRTSRTATDSGTLEPGELGELRALAADPRLAAEAGTRPYPDDCADAFTYSVTVGPTRVGYVDCGGDDAPEVASALARLVLTATQR